MKEIEIFIVRLKKKKGVFTTAQVNKLVKGICSTQQMEEPEVSINERAGSRAGHRKRKVKVALQY
ncbi:hypothetical protein [Longitalea luteola]|uniref:hypothetical protein n=1 Tax=Longitalea luteola TaxID=2812563 RepID=UPI001A970E86|nr:hypothetical protein [Longitalea luteola]